VAKQTLSRELRTMGYRKLSARPRHHAQAEGAIEKFKKTSPRAWTKSRARRASIRLNRDLVADEARIGQKTRPRGAGQARHKTLGPKRPAHRFDLHLRRHLSQGGKGAGLVLPVAISRR